MWEAATDGRRLKFHLTGINNQNFIMADEETGTWWQQVSGEAIHGPLKGRRLNGVFHDELTFATWRRERPQGRVLRPSEDNDAWRKFSERWEEQTAKLPVVTQAAAQDKLTPRAVVLGVNLNGAAKAYPLESVERQSPLVDKVGDVPLVVVLGEDKKSVRAFETTVDGRALEFYVKADAGGGGAWRMFDGETRSEWDFTGRAVAGALAGRQLKKIPLLKDYWFDWKLYNPQTLVYAFNAP
ncbi:MAG: hypothetical protein QOE47_386 [Pyrinomonadaceae bacterium]|nr:hypothetical protein [Pyrinomonadaceae bacterium]